MCLTHVKERRWSSVCCVAGLLVVVALVQMIINSRLVLVLSLSLSHLFLLSALSFSFSDLISLFFLCLLCLSSFSLLFFLFISMDATIENTMHSQIVFVLKGDDNKLGPHGPHKISVHIELS